MNAWMDVGADVGNVHKTNEKPNFISIFAAKARDCTTHIDCTSIPSTSCVRDADERLRCLCGDNKAPINGQCSDTKKGKLVRFTVT